MSALALQACFEDRMLWIINNCAAVAIDHLSNDMESTATINASFLLIFYADG